MRPAVDEAEEAKARLLEPRVRHHGQNLDLDRPGQRQAVLGDGRGILGRIERDVHRFPVATRNPRDKARLAEARAKREAGNRRGTAAPQGIVEPASAGLGRRRPRGSRMAWLGSRPKTPVETAVCLETMVPLVRLELTTPSLRMMCSTG